MIKTTSSTFKTRSSPGTIPGTLRKLPGAEPPTVKLIAFSSEEFREQDQPSIDDIRAHKTTGSVVWLDVAGLADIDLITRIGDEFGLHRLALEDVVHVHQRAKAEPYDNHVYLAIRMMLAQTAPKTEQVSLFVGSGYVISFQEQRGDTFEPIRDQLRHKKGRIRERGADYLAYALLDTIVDQYFPVLETYGEAIEHLEELVMRQPDPRLVRDLHVLKRDLLGIRRAVWPMRELLTSLMRESTPAITDGTRLFLRDAYDHTVQLMDIVETYRELASGLIDIYLSSINNRMNEIMKVLTMISTIFLPLGFIASLYGMNFDRSASPWNMPELGWFLGYPFALLLMLACATVMLAAFWKRGWFEAPSARKGLLHGPRHWSKRRAGSG